MPVASENAPPRRRSRSRSPDAPRKRVKESEGWERSDGSGRRRGRTTSRSRESSHSRSRSRSQSQSRLHKGTRHTNKTSGSRKQKEHSRSRSRSQSSDSGGPPRQTAARHKRKVADISTKQKELKDKLSLTGKAIGRAVAFNCDFNLLVECLAAEVDKEGLPEEADATFLAVVKRCKFYQPYIIELFRKAGQKYLMMPADILTVLRHGREHAQNVDIASIKDSISRIFEEIKFDPPLDPRNGKMLMGFNHAQCAKLLRPFNADWRDEDVRTNYLESTWSASAEDFPAFVLASPSEDAAEEDPSDVLDRIFLAPCLLRVARIILFGPSHVRTSPKQASEKCNSTRNGIKKTTTAFVAYVVVLLRFCLSEEAIYGNTQFAYIELYEGIVKHLDDAEFADERKNILKAWDTELFSQLPVKAAPATTGIPSGVQGGTKHLKHLKMQRLAAITLAADRQPPSPAQDEDNDAARATAAAQALADLGRNPLAPLN